MNIDAYEEEKPHGHGELCFTACEGIGLLSATLVKLLLLPCARGYYHCVDQVVEIWKAA